LLSPKPKRNFRFRRPWAIIQYDHEERDLEDEEKGTRKQPLKNSYKERPQGYKHKKMMDPRRHNENEELKYPFITRRSTT
jgi:hypothetical protein